MAARLAIGFHPTNPLSLGARRSRAAGARVWFSTLTLPAATRAPIARFVDAAESDDPALVGNALADVAKALGALLDVPSRAELSGIVKALAAP
jgi:hypothetical protein